MNDYDRITRMIRCLEKPHTGQPELAVLAKQVGLSLFNFHGLFTRWAGVTPKAFFQCLTLAHAKALLRQSRGVLDPAMDAGPSGPARLRDLGAALDAASPGELRSDDPPWTIAAGFGPTPFGDALVAESPRGICHLAFVEPRSETSAWAELRRAWSNATFCRDDRAAKRLLQGVFSGRGDGGPRPRLRAFVRGTPFQVQVWRALIRLPAGRLTTYARLAAALGRPSAARAVGSAVAQNPVAYLIPCHRVIRETGVIGDYRWGPVRKRAIVAWESARQAE